MFFYYTSLHIFKQENNQPAANQFEITHLTIENLAATIRLTPKY